MVGAASEGASQIVKKISRRGQTGGFLIPQTKINQLIAFKHLLTEKQKQDILNTLLTAGSLTIRPTRVQSSGFLGVLFASISVLIAVDLVSKIFKGSGAPQMGVHGKSC